MTNDSFHIITVFFLVLSLPLGCRDLIKLPVTGLLASCRYDVRRCSLKCSCFESVLFEAFLSSHLLKPPDSTKTRMCRALWYLVIWLCKSSDPLIRLFSISSAKENTMLIFFICETNQFSIFFQYFKCKENTRLIFSLYKSTKFIVSVYQMEQKQKQCYSFS